MFCKKCGTKLADGAKFCPACGAASSQAGGAQTPVPSQDVFQNALASRPAPAAGGAPAAVRSGNRKLGRVARAGAAAGLAGVYSSADCWGGPRRRWARPSPSPPGPIRRPPTPWGCLT